MRITVKKGDVEITISENETGTTQKVPSMKWSDENKQIQETIKVMTELVNKLVNNK